MHRGEVNCELAITAVFFVYPLINASSGTLLWRFHIVVFILGHLGYSQADRSTRYFPKSLFFALFFSATLIGCLGYSELQIYLVNVLKVSFLTELDAALFEQSLVGSGVAYLP